MFDIMFNPADVRYVLENHLVDALKDKTSEIGTIAFILQASMEALEKIEAEDTTNAEI